MKKFAKIITNKYLLVAAFFIAWMLFFDQRDFFYVLEQKQKLKNATLKKEYYLHEIEKAKKDLADLQNSNAALEKFAREKYMMKKDGEDIYLITEPTEKK